MKSLKSILLAAAVCCASAAFAQNGVERTAHKVGHTTSRIATKTAHKTSELASKGAADVVDRKYEGKCAPNGEDVYIDKHSRYYWVNKKGHHVYVTKWQLRDKHHMKM